MRSTVQSDVQPDRIDDAFLFGAQYYRAPTPEPACWEADLQRMAELGFNAVKFWVQWRWTHRNPDRFVFDDLDRLMDLAAANNLGVTLNTIFDVAPVWLYDRWPDAKQVTNNGRTVEPRAVSCRQLGGQPGPCYNHPGAREARQAFLNETVEHFRGHPAMAMWDVWNEPELCLPQRRPEVDTLVCYCPHCRSQFLDWLRRKYDTIETLNAVWGRCYGEWDQVELPRTAETVTDFVDWREFHVDTLTLEAAWRVELVRKLDTGHTVYLHVVPNTMAPFNMVTTAGDDFALADLCDVFASTMNGGPVFPAQVASAARGKTIYNVESHINHGCTALHQPVLSDANVLRDLVPQLGFGVRGFLFWQYRPEILGLEAPAWGLVGLDGGDRPVTRAVARFGERLQPHTRALLASAPASAEVGIWKSRRNEIFHFAVHKEFGPLIDSVEGYIRTLYRLNIPYRIINETMLERGELDGLKVLIVPAPYYMTETEAGSLAAWVENGGVLLADAHLAGYNATTGRHSRVIPGCGLAERWGVRESDSTSSYHLTLPRSEAFTGSVTADVAKALADAGTSGGARFPVRRPDGALLCGALRYAVFAGDDISTEGTLDGDTACLVSKRIGQGRVWLAGTNLGQGGRTEPEALATFLSEVTSGAGVRPTLGAVSPSPDVHVDALGEPGRPRFLVLANRGDAAELTLAVDLTGTGVFSGREFHVRAGEPLQLPAGQAELVAVRSVTGC
jgi:beta-galactosidase